MMKKLIKRIAVLGLSFILAMGFLLESRMPKIVRADEAGNVDADFSINAFHNLDYTFSTMDGGTAGTKVLPSKDVTVLIFGRTTCATTWIRVKVIAESSWIYDEKVSVIYIDIDGADAEVIQGSIDQYALMCQDADLYRRGCEKIVFCCDADEKNEEIRKEYHSLSRKWGTLYLPMIMIVDKNDIVREMLTGAKTAEEIYSVMNQVIAKANLEEEEKENNSGNDNPEKDNTEEDDSEKNITGEDESGKDVVEKVDSSNESNAGGDVLKPNNTGNGDGNVQIKYVKGTVKSIKLTAPRKTLRVGETMKLKALVKTTGENANKKLKWSSSKKKYAVVNQKGKVKAKKAGKGKMVTITAKAMDGSGKKAKIKIRIGEN